MTMINYKFPEFYENIISKIPGWFGNLDAAIFDIILRFQFENKLIKNILEIGVWEGKSAALLSIYANLAKINS